MPANLADRYRRTCALTEALVAPLSDADATVQSMDDASPAKWHLAHTTWFFETFVLRDHLPDYRLYRDDWSFLFNSYYEAEGPRHTSLAARVALATHRWTKCSIGAPMSMRRWRRCSIGPSCTG